MKKFLFGLFATSIFSILFAICEPALAGQTDSLIDKLIQKGIITEEDAREIREEEQKAEQRQEEKIVKKIEGKGLPLPKGLQGIKVGMLGYVDYSNGDSPESNDGESDLNDFRLTRGYLTVEKEFLPWLHARATLDTTQKSDGDWEMRMKYYYAELRPPDLGSLTAMQSEVGMGHIPWLDFEEHINPYRCQGTMAIERAGVFNSADLGVSIRGDIGGKLEDSEEKIGDHHYDGHYGTWHVGVYNGSGYHASEDNPNKVVEGRLTWRPLPELIPGLQLSYFGILGEGNAETDAPDYNVNLGMLSYQNPWVIFTGQYFATEGNAKGDWVNSQGDPLNTNGYSAFGNLKLPVLEKKLSLFARYDHFDQDDDGEIAVDADYDMYIAGLAYDIYKGNLVLLDFETTDYGRDAGKKGKIPVPNNNLGDDQRVQVVYQIKF